MKTETQENAFMFNKKYHASRTYSPPKDTVRPCIICGWAEHMAIHDARNAHIAGYFHPYKLETTK